MQRPYNDRWERTKWYLFRNLLENPGFRLSPVPEESRSESSDDRPYSPLPDLIIEREPNRHDETEEFYQGLEVRMKRYYRSLFVDGEEECGDLINSDSEMSGFEVNQSMASTFIINENYRELSESNELKTSEHRFDSEKITVGRGDRCYEIGNSSNSNHSDSEHSSQNERTEAITDLDKSEDMRVQSNEYKTIDTESDSPQDCHKISITKVEIHEEKKRSKPLIRVFEDGSPVLIPRCKKFSRIVFGNMSRDIINSIPSNDNVIEDVSKDKLEVDEGSVNIIENHSKQPIYLEISSEESDLELQWLMKNPRASSTAFCKSSETEITETSEHIISKHEDQEEIAKDPEEIDDDNNEAMAETEKIHNLQSESDDEQFKTVGSIGSDEFNPTNINVVDNSIELAITKGMFQTKNRVKISSFGTNEGEYGSEEFEDVEVMRGTLHTRFNENLQRESTSSQENPIIRTCATKTTAREIEEDSDHANDVINASLEHSEDIPTEFHQSFQRVSTSNDNSAFISKLISQAEENEHPNKDGKESNEIADTTPSIKHSKCVKDACNDIWSVSPININFEELPPHAAEIPISVGGVFNENKREFSEIIEESAPKSKKKKYKNAEIQTSATKKPRNTWNDIKTNLFVGSPLIYKLCGCKDHVCS